MPNPQASVLDVNPLQSQHLEQLVHRSTTAQRLVKRGHIILEAAKGVSNSQIAQHLHMGYETVRRWRDRWYRAESRLQAVEATGKPKLLRQAIEVLLTDEQRPGAPEVIAALNGGLLTFLDFLGVKNVSKQMRHFCAQPREALQLLLGKLSRENG